MDLWGRNYTLGDTVPDCTIHHNAGVLVDSVLHNLGGRGGVEGTRREHASGCMPIELTARLAPVHGKEDLGKGSTLESL